MKLGIMQPYFFPYVGYWQLIKAVDKYIVYDDVTYIKGGWISRNNILLNGCKHLITLPLDTPSSFRLIKEIKVTSNVKQREKILKTIENAYKKAPYFSDVMPIIENCIMKSEYISELNFNAIKEICSYLDIKTEIILSSDLKKNNELKSQEKVIHINKLMGSDMYINAIGGQELYSKEAFKKEGICLKFLKMDNIEYQQFSNEFVPNLSIIDVMMFNSRDDVNSILDMYSLVTNS